MKRFSLILVLLLAASPAWAAKKVTVAQLKDMMASMQQSKKTDAEMAAALKQVELSEELTRSEMNALAQYVSGPAATEQIYVLEARSAILSPPAADLPSTPAPDAAAQKAILDKAVDYATKTYAQLQLTATKTTIRFQDNVEALAAGSGMHSGATESAQTDPNLVNASQFVHYINSTETPAVIHNGVEDNPLAKDKTKWGQNGYIALLGQGPALSSIVQDAQAAGKINFLRWETVNGKAAAVFAYSVDKKKSHYAVNYCCFPQTDQTGVARFTSASGVGAGQPGGTQGAAGGAKGNFQTNTTYDQYYKGTIGYHGEIFVDPDTGIVVRLVTQGEFKTSDLVHQEDLRIDYAPMPVGGKTMVVPVKTVVNTEVVPNGDAGTGKFMLRHTLFTAEYKNFQPGN